MAQRRQLPCSKSFSMLWKRVPAHWPFSHQRALHDGNDSHKENERCSRWLSPDSAGTYCCWKDTLTKKGLLEKPEINQHLLQEFSPQEEILV
ncbi:rCG49664 [Rattus norvegicus]|uniref:RCG49664 n=1 Tax=Rattus norvegicus TaxID=10116 RepID=A6K2G6_RAT|nr:rCG49664 [Rattus norvegicus]